MKVVIALFALVAVAHSAVIFSGLPMAYSALPALTIEPEITKFSFKAVEKEADFAHPGYVAITPGAKHVAPLPFPGASHHVNMAKAPGTKK